MAAAGPAQQSPRGSLHLPTGRTPGTRAPRLPVRAGSAGAARGSEGQACAWSAPRTVATSFLFSGGCLTGLPGSPGSAASLCSAPPPVPRAVAASPASHPCRPRGRSRVNIGRHEPFAARGRGGAETRISFRLGHPSVCRSFKGIWLQPLVGGKGRPIQSGNFIPNLPISPISTEIAKTWGYPAGKAT